MKRIFLPLLVLLCIQGNGQDAGLRLPSILGDHMVLQRNTVVNIWGWADPEAAVKVVTSWNEKSYLSVCDSTGKWLVAAETGEAGGPYEISISAGSTIVLKDILLGELWVCSGQSNMEFALASAQSAPIEIPAADLPGIRLFQVEKRIASSPKPDAGGEWKVCTPKTASQFSAVGYFFGKILHMELGVPIGLVNSSWGGTPSEAWTSRETLVALGGFNENSRF